MGSVVIKDGGLFQIFQPPVARHLAVVLVELAVAAFPIVKLARAQFQPAQQAFGRQFSAIRPALDIIDNLVASVVGNPASL